MSNGYQLPADWEKRLERTLNLCAGVDSKNKAYICSPCRGNDYDETYDNIIAARFYMYYSSIETSFHARAPHAYLGFLLDDTNTFERSMALRFGQGFLVSNDQILVCGDTISIGMRAEIESAARLNMPIWCFNRGVYTQVCDIVKPLCIGELPVSLHEEHPMLGKATATLLKEGVI